LATLRPFTVWTKSQTARLSTTLAPLTRPCALRALQAINLAKGLTRIAEIPPSEDGFSLAQHIGQAGNVDVTSAAYFDVGHGVIFDPAANGVGSYPYPLRELLLRGHRRQYREV